MKFTPIASKKPEKQPFFLCRYQESYQEYYQAYYQVYLSSSSAAQKNSKQEKNSEQKELIDYQREKLFLRNQIRHKNIFFKEKGFYCKKND